MAVPTRGHRRPHLAAALSLLLLVLSSSGTSLARAGAGPTGPIKTVVVVVMENRSFDHMLGWMKRLNPAIDGVTGAEWNPSSTSDPASPRVYFGDGAQFVDPDPGHSYQEIRQQIFGSDDASGAPKMNGFVQQAVSIGGGNMTAAVMNGFAPDSVAVYRELVSQFAVCDRWFASVPSSTQTNCLFVHSGTSGGATSNNPDAGSSLMGSNSVKWPYGVDSLELGVKLAAAGTVASTAAEEPEQGFAFVHRKIFDHDINCYKKVPITGF